MTKFTASRYITVEETVENFYIIFLSEDTGHDETAQRVKTIIGQIYRFAIAVGWADTDPTSALLGALRPRNNSIMQL